MISVRLIGHDLQYEINGLLKAFFFNETIIFIDNLDDYKEGLLIVNELKKISDKIQTNTKIYKDGHLIYNGTIGDIKGIKVDKGSLKKRIRIGVKQSIYDGLNSFSETKVPWGILTGIRPVKIVHNLIDEGVDDKGIVDILTKEYRLSQQKSLLVLDIGKEQRKYLYPLDRERFSLYISIPFCPTRCLYCSFPSLSIEKYKDYVGIYIDKLIYEITRVGELMRDNTISTVYIGGGTPSAIETRDLERIIHSIYDNFSKNNIEEMTVEAGRPDTIDNELLKMLKENGVGRISINPQTMNDKTLQLIGRLHCSQDIINTYFKARDIGFDVVNMDLIIGLPSEGIEEVRNSLKGLKALNPENLTVHTLSIKKGSRFAKFMDRYELKDQGTIGAMLNETKSFADEMGLSPYYLYRQKLIMGNFENVGYAKKGKDCKYNIKMMEEKETILGLGMGAVSKVFYPKEDRIERVPNVKSLEEYLKRVEEMVGRKVKAISCLNKFEL